MSEWRTIPDFPNYECHCSCYDGVKVRRIVYIRGKVMGMKTNNRIKGGNIIMSKNGVYRIRKVPSGQEHSLSEKNIYGATWEGEELIPITKINRNKN